jgi:hypothetical protein
VRVGGQTRVGTGSGDDTVRLTDCTFGGAVSVGTGKGDDAVTTLSEFRRGVAVNDGPGDDTISRGAVRRFDFRDGEQGWAGGFAESNLNPETYESGLRPLPPEVGDGTGFLLAGTGVDLFMFMTRGLGPRDGVAPRQAYHLTYDITLATNGLADRGLYLKAGGSTVEPVAPGGVRLIVDKGNQARSGPAGSVVGDRELDTGLPQHLKGSDGPFVSQRFRHTHPTPVPSDAKGRLWLLIGTEDASLGGFPGTPLYYQSVTVTLTPAAG